MKRRLFAILSAVSLLLFLACLALSCLIPSFPDYDDGLSAPRHVLRYTLMATVLFLSAFVGSTYIARGHRVEQGVCAACGYDLRATPNRCPECGTVPTR